MKRLIHIGLSLVFLSVPMLSSAQTSIETSNQKVETIKTDTTKGIATKSGDNRSSLQFDLESTPEVKVFPNPASSKINIHLTGWTGTVRIRFVNVVGATPIDEMAEEDQLELAVDKLAKGVYVVSVDNGVTIKYKRILIN